jgi:reactive chlorine resistance protein C
MLEYLAQARGQFFNLMRLAIFIVMAWIGGLKAFQYEADGIVPFVANSPVMSFFYKDEAPEYKKYKNKEGEVVKGNIEWHDPICWELRSSLLDW